MAISFYNTLIRTEVEKIFVVLQSKAPLRDHFVRRSIYLSVNICYNVIIWMGIIGVCMPNMKPLSLTVRKL